MQSIMNGGVPLWNVFSIFEDSLPNAMLVKLIIAILSYWMSPQSVADAVSNGFIQISQQIAMTAIPTYLVGPSPANKSKFHDQRELWFSKIVVSPVCKAANCIGLNTGTTW